MDGHEGVSHASWECLLGDKWSGSKFESRIDRGRGREIVQHNVDDSELVTC